MSLTVETGISQEEQECNFMNATLDEIKDNTAISIAVTLPERSLDKIDCNNKKQVKDKMAEIFSSALAFGCKIEIQIGCVELEDGDPEIEDPERI